MQDFYTVYHAVSNCETLALYINCANIAIVVNWLIAVLILIKNEDDICMLKGV